MILRVAFGGQGCCLAALELSGSTGQVEGQVDRLKQFIRQMYERAKSDLFRAKVLVSVDLFTKIADKLQAESESPLGMDRGALNGICRVKNHSSLLVSDVTMPRQAHANIGVKR